jgi:hypothetical protein
MKRKKKQIFDEEKHEDVKRHGRIISAKPTEWHKDKTKYNRTEKHKKDLSE